MGSYSHSCGCEIWETPAKLSILVQATCFLKFYNLKFLFEIKKLNKSKYIKNKELVSTSATQICLFTLYAHAGVCTYVRL